MINPFKEVDWHPDRARRRSFAISLIIGFPATALIFLVMAFLRGRGWDLGTAAAIGGVGAAAGLLFLMVPAIVRPFYVAWYFLACCIGLVIGNILMTLIFYVFVVGVGLAMRAAGRRAMRITVDRASPSYWLDAGPRPEAKRYYRQF